MIVSGIEDTATAKDSPGHEEDGCGRILLSKSVPWGRVDEVRCFEKSEADPYIDVEAEDGGPEIHVI